MDRFDILIKKLDHIISVVEDINSAPFSALVAKFESNCLRCNEPIRVGESLIYNKQIRKSWHSRCD